MKKKCSIPGCGERPPNGKPFCLPHWLKAPDALRRRISAASGASQGDQRGVVYQRAVAEVVANLTSRG